MEVILLENVRNVGRLGEKVNVKPGFGRNFLFPQGKAAPATTENLAEFEKRRAELEAKMAEALKAAQTRADALAAITVTITSKAGDGGKLFGSIGTRDIANAISQAGVSVEKHEVILPEGTIRHLGEFDIDIHLHSEVTSTIKLTVVAEQ